MRYEAVFIIIIIFFFFLLLLLLSSNRPHGLLRSFQLVIEQEEASPVEGRGRHL
jgi:hypothetical protein